MAALLKSSEQLECSNPNDGRFVVLQPVGVGICVASVPEGVWFGCVTWFPCGLGGGQVCWLWLQALGW